MCGCTSLRVRATHLARATARGPFRTWERQAGPRPPPQPRQLAAFCVLFLIFQRWLLACAAPQAAARWLYHNQADGYSAATADNRCFATKKCTVHQQLLAAARWLGVRPAARSDRCSAAMAASQPKSAPKIFRRRAGSVYACISRDRLGLALFFVSV